MLRSPAPPPSLDVLREVSRSFFLSIRLLPRALREPIGLAYLLARATDTIADTSRVPPDRRRDLLDRTAAAIEGADDPALGLAANEFAAQVAHEGERRLMAMLGDCIAALAALDAADREDIRTVLRAIVRGQRLDIERPRLRDAHELREYTYLVAGSVGEFWTDLCARHVARFADRPVAEMRALGREFGCALQLVNILRDADDDARAGRRYLPANDATDWHEEAARGLQAGMDYALATRSRRIRAAVALPAILGRRTLARLDAQRRAHGRPQLQAGPLAYAPTPAARVKVPRREVRALLLHLALRLASRGALRSEWDNRPR